MIQIILLFQPVSYDLDWNRYKGSFLMRKGQSAWAKKDLGLSEMRRISPSSGLSLIGNLVYSRFHSVHNLSNGKGWINRELVADGFSLARRLAGSMMRLGKRLIKERQTND
jgi:hypothetical protein